MSYLLVPGEVSATSATIWVGALNEQPAGLPVTLEYGAGSQVIGGWSHWASKDGALTLDHRREPLAGLSPRQTYNLALRVNNDVRAAASVTTLPDRLPAPGAKPFTILLGSCFCAAKDGAGKVGQTFFQLPSAARPELKVLCGDQVYLDSPWHHYLLHTHSPAELESEFFANYRNTWTQSSPAAGFLQLLSDGANYFSSDDHEYWNNAPNAGVYVRDTWSAGGRRDWLKAAGELYAGFQSEAAQAPRFKVPPLALYNADTRIHRSENRTTLMPKGDMDDLCAWIGALEGPGLLVVGQPVLTGKTGFQGHFSDWGLADYEQYQGLVQALAAAKHSVVILTGDVHFGRVASCTLASGADLVEVIASPLELVDDKAKGTWGKAPDLFPAFAISGVARATVQTTAGFSPNDAHFLTLEFSAAGARVKMTVRAWSIQGKPSPWTGQTIFERTLQ